MEEEWIHDQDETPIKRRASHIRSCSAYGCSSKGYRLLIGGERVQYFPFPLADRDLCHRWASAVKLPTGSPFEKSFICSKHFRATDYKARINDDSKKTLRRTAIPSLEPVVATTKPQNRKKILTEDSSDYTDDDDSAKEITTLVSKEGTDGENLTVLVVKDPQAEDTSDDEDFEKPKLLQQNKKIPLLCRDLLASGAPYPWRKQGLESWATERMASHEEQLQKTRNAITEEQEKINLLQQQIDARKEILALAVIKKSFGRMILSQYLKTLE